MKNYGNLTIQRCATFATSIALLVLVTQAASAQVSNNSGTPVAGLLVGDIQVNQNNPEAAVGVAVENLCPQLVVRQGLQQNSAMQTDLLQRCGDLIFDETPQTANLRQVAPEEMATQETDIVELSSYQLSSVGARLAGLRSSIQSSTQQVSLQHAQPGLLALNLTRNGGGAGDSIASQGRLGVYINATIASGDKDQTANESGFDIDSTGVTLGVDYRLGNDAFIGAALGYNESDSEMSNNGGDVDAEGISLMVYGTKNLAERWYLEGTLGSSQYDYEIRRNLNYSARATAVDQQALASTEADITFSSVGVGLNPELESEGGMQVSYSARVNYLDADVDGFTERMSNPSANGFGMNLQLASQQIESLTSVLGVQVSKVFATNSGIIIPFAGLSYIHEFEDDPRTIMARFANDPFSIGFNQTSGSFPNGSQATNNGQPVPTIISILTDAPDSDYFRFAIGTSGVLPGGKNWFVSADSTLGLSNTSYYSLTAGFRGEF